MYLYFCFNSFLFKLNFFFTTNTMQAMLKKTAIFFVKILVNTLIKILFLNKNGRLKIDF